MPGTTISRGNILNETMLYIQAITWSTAALTSTTAELTATVPGLLDGDVPYMMLVNTAMPTGVSYSNIRVSAANTLAVTWSTTGTVTIPTGPWMIGVIRPEVIRTQLPNNAV
jgi:hypothetical protein